MVLSIARPPHSEIEMPSQRLADLDPREVALAASAPSNSVKRSPLAFFLQVVAGVALGIGLINLSERYGISSSGPIIVLLVLGYCVSIFAHEAGHAIAAALQGFHISGFAVWPARIHRDRSSWRILWLARKGPKGFVAVSALGIHQLRRRQFIVVAMGPLTSALVAVACGLVARLNRTAPRWLLDQLWITALWSVVFALGGLLPLRTGATVSDGARLLMLIRGGADWDRMNAQQAIVAAGNRGTRPREGPPDLIETATGVDHGSEDARVGRALRYNWLADRGRIDEAEDQIVWLLLHARSASVLQAWQFEAAWFAAFYHADATTARRWYEAALAASAPTEDCSLSMAAAANRRGIVRMRTPHRSRHTALAAREALLELLARGENAGAN